MQGNRSNQLHATLLLAATLAIASALSIAHAAAQQQPTTSANDPNTAAQIAQSPDERAFKQMLVKNSPWTVEWKSRRGGTGTNNIAFALGDDGVTITGRYSGSFTNPDGPLKDIAIRKNCLSFLLPHGTKYDYCLAADGVLKGTYEGSTRRADTFIGEAIAKPAAK